MVIFHSYVNVDQRVAIAATPSSGIWPIEVRPFRAHPGASRGEGGQTQRAAPSGWWISIAIAKFLGLKVGYLSWMQGFFFSELGQGRPGSFLNTILDIYNNQSTDITITI